MLCEIITLTLTDEVSGDGDGADVKQVLMFGSKISICCLFACWGLINGQIFILITLLFGMELKARISLI